MSIQAVRSRTTPIPQSDFIVYQRFADGTEKSVGAETADGARDCAAWLQEEDPGSYVTWYPLVRAGRDAA